MLTRILNKLERFTQINETEILQQIFRSTELQELIIELNTQDQLFEKGEDKLGRRLDAIGGGYSFYTIALKQQKGQPTDRVTLKDTGAFYDSFKVVVPSGEDYIIIIANPIKDGKDINEEWGGYIIGLQQENIYKVIDYIREKAPIIIRQKWLEA